MTVEERLTALEQEVAALKGETAALKAETLDDIERRATRNADAAIAKQRAEAHARQTNAVVVNLQNEVAAEERREQVSLARVAKIKARLTEKLATPCPTHGLERDLWLREREELEITLDEIRRGPDGLSGDGLLRQLAKEDGQPMLPCLIQTQQTLARLRAELAAAEAVA